MVALFSLDIDIDIIMVIIFSQQLKESELFETVYNNHFKPEIIDTMIRKKKIYLLSTLANKFTELIRKHQDPDAETFRYVFLSLILL